MSQKTLPPPECVAGWDVSHVADWLRHNDMSEFVVTFGKNNVNGSRLLELDENTVRSFNINLPQQKITKLLDKVRKSKKEKTGLFNKLKQSRNSSVPAVPDRDYKRSTNQLQKAEEDDGGWGSDFSDDDDVGLDDDYEPPPDPVRSEAPRYPQTSNHSQFNSQVRSHYSDEDDSIEDYIEPIESAHFDNDEDEETYLAPNGEDELYEVPEDDSSHFQARIPTVKPPARPPKTNKDYISNHSRPPQILAPAPSLSKSIDVAPRPPARRSASPARSPYSYRPQTEDNEEFEEDTYEAPNNEEDYNEMYAVPEDTSPHPRPEQRPVQPPPSLSSRPKIIPKQQTPNFMKAPARTPWLPPSPKNTNSFTSSANNVPPPIVRYPKTDTYKAANEPLGSNSTSETPTSKADDNSAPAISRMKQIFEKRSPTLPRRDDCNGTSKVNETKKSSFLHTVGKPLPQPPLPSKNDVPLKEPRGSTQPDLPVRKPALLQRPPALTSNLTSSDSLKLHPNPVQRNPSSPSHRTPTIPQQASARSPANSMDGYPWYHADLARDKAHKSLEEFRRDGAFLVRISKRGGQKNPYTLSLWYNNQVRNLLIRRRSDEKYALGSEKEGEQTFDSPLELVEFHQSNPLILANNEGKTKLKHPCPIQ